MIEKYNILDNIDIGTEFNFTDTMGSLVINNEFSKGFVDYKAGNQTKQSYIWNALSSISDTLGQTIYNNVESYIDNVCNIETCKIKSLASIMHMLGMDYYIMDEYDSIPIEILNLMNLFSIDRKYFTQGEKIKPQILSAFRDYGVIQGNVDTYELCGREYIRDNTIFNQTKYKDFLSVVYHDVITDILTKQYDDKISVYMFPQSVENIERKYITKFDTEDTYYNLKRKYGVRTDFDNDNIFWDIEYGYDSIDNYSGYELSILTKMKEDRSHSYDNIKTSRYYYYSVKKIEDYIQFITNKHYSTTLSSTDELNYEYDNNFFKLANRKQIKLFLKTDDSTGKTKDEILRDYIDNNILDTVIKALIRSTLYIQKLRNKIKLQTRKNYMKGTNNLLVYAINEYLINYFDNNDVSSIQTLNSDSFLENIDIVEYDDNTQYFNIATNNDHYSNLGGSTCNGRFWEDKLNSDGLNFSLQQIQEFYLSVMNMKYDSVLSNEQSKNEFLTEFLDTIYDCGAQKMSYNKNGFINTQIERDGEYTEELFQRLISLSSNYKDYDSNIDHSEYSYPQDTLSNQISDVMQNHIYPKLSSQYLSAISDVYNEFSDDVLGISSNLNDVTQEYENILSGNQSFYFNKPSQEDYPYSYEDGQYKHPTSYYVSSQYDVGLKYIYDKILRLQSFVVQDGNIRNYPIIDAVEVISANLYDISSTLMNGVIHKIEPYGYVDISSDDMTQEMDSADSFLNNKITERYTILQSNIDTIRQQSNTLLTIYNSLYQNATNLMANYSGGDVSSMWISFGAGECKSREKDVGYLRNTKPDTKHDWVYNYNDGFLYAAVNEGETGKYHVLPGLENKQVVTKDNLYGMITTFMEYLQQCTGLVCYCTTVEGEHNHQYEKLTGKMNVGTYSAASQLLVQYEDITQQVNKVQAAYEQMVDETTFSQTSSLKDQIIELIEKVSDQKFPEKVYAKDTMIQTYRKYLALIVQIRKEYSVLYERYQVIYQDPKQTTYLADAKNIDSLKFQCLENIVKYVKTTDNTNRENLKTKIQKLLDKYTQLVYDTIYLISEMSKRETLPSQYKYSGNVLEIELENIIKFLLQDIQNKYERGINYIQIEIYYIQSKLNNVLKELTQFLDVEINFDEAVSTRINELNFFENETYKKHEKMFLSYSGGTFGYYPYFNFQNEEHPSYQIHPFMWNLVESGDALENIGVVILNSFIRDFEPENIYDKIHEYIGDIGQSINEWKNGVFDFTGYTSGYENSKHSDSNVLTSEVVDFDGIFYPNAIAEFTQNYERSIRCMNMYFEKNIRPTSKNMAYLAAKEAITRRNISSCSGNDVIDILRNNIIVSAYTEYVSENEFYIGLATVDGELSSNVRNDVTINGMTNILKNTISPSFYEKFYNHLDLNVGDMKFQINQLTTYRDDIYEMSMERDISSQYDIYRYQKDCFGNSFILLKQYNNDKPSFKFKQNTLGEIWIRRKNHPFAFPAFSGRYPNVEITEQRYCAPSIYRLENTYEYGNILPIEQKVCKFFDIDFSENGQTLYMFAKQTDKGIKTPLGIKERFNENEDNPQFDIYESCAIIFGYLNKHKLQEDDDRTILTIYDNQYSSNMVDYIYSAKNGIDKRPDQMSEDTRTISSYSYVGLYKTSSNDTCFVYANKEFNISGDIRLLPARQVRIFEHENSNITNEYESDGGCSVKSDQTLFDKPYDGQICMSYSNGKITFAYLISQKCEDSGRCDGHTLDDPTDTEMNSNDIFDQSICIVDTKIRDRKIIPYDKNTQGIQSNINADISYVPVYPSLELSNSTDITRNSKILKTIGGDYVSIQLMGNSKNLDNVIKNTNTDYTPYYDYENIRDNYEFGRVYEDYDKILDSNITQLKNPVLKVDNAGIISWKTDIVEIQSLNISKYKVLFQNMDTLGKFPYYVGSLENLYNQTKTVSYDEKYKYEQIIHKDDGHEQTITGMNPYTRTRYKSNHIDGIKSMSIGFNSDDKGGFFEVTMYGDDTKPNKYISVSKDKLQIILFNPDDMRYLMKFHMLDAYGIMRAYDMDKDQSHRYVIDSDNWTIITETPESDIDEVKRKLKSYYINKFGFREFLEDISITDYSSLENVWIFNSNRNLQFKYDEGMFFDIGDERYYYPSINKKYPKSVSEKYEQQINDVNNEILIDRIYENNNVYILSALDPVKTADNIGTVTIPKHQIDGEFYMAFEDYLSSSVVDGKKINNYDKFANGDDSNMELITGYLHSFENSHKWSEYDIEDQDVFMEINRIHKTEEYVNRFSNSKVDVDINSNNTILSDYTNIFVSYKKTQNLDIELYFNYFNFLDSRFVEIGEDGKEYFKCIEDSYLKLGKGEDGFLNIYVQVKDFDIYGNLFGIKTIVLATYHIFNTSDDKPKFVIIKTYDVANGDNYKNYQGELLIRCENINVDVSKYPVLPSEKIEFQVTIHTERNNDFQNFEMQVEIEQDILRIYEEDNDKYSVDYRDGIAYIKVKNDIQNIPLRCVSEKTKQELTELTNRRYPISITANALEKITIIDGSITFYGGNMETALVDFTSTTTLSPSFVGVLNENVIDGNEIYRVT